MGKALVTRIFFVTANDDNGDQIRFSGFNTAQIIDNLGVIEVYISFNNGVNKSWSASQWGSSLTAAVNKFEAMLARIMAANPEKRYLKIKNSTNETIITYYDVDWVQMAAISVANGISIGGGSAYDYDAGLVAKLSSEWPQAPQGVIDLGT